MTIWDIITTATSNMLRSKLRTFLTIIAIFIGALTISLTLGISSGISSYIDSQVATVGAEDLLIIQKKIEISNNSDGPRKYDSSKTATSAQAALLNLTLTDKDVDKIRTIKGLHDIKPILVVSPSYIEGVNHEKYQLDVQQVLEGSGADLTAGNAPQNSSSAAQILLTPDYVHALGYGSDQDAVGKSVTIAVKTPLAKLKTVQATIVGVQQKSILTNSGMAINDTLVNQLHAIQTEGLPATANSEYAGVLSRFDPSAGTDSLHDIKQTLEQKGYQGQTVSDKIGVIKDIIDAITAVLIFFGAIALLAASFGVINTLFMSVQERTKEIGLMKAMGMSRSRVFMLFSIEAILLGFWGSILGVGVAMIAGTFINRVASNSFLKELPGFSLTTFPLIPTVTVVLIIMLITFLAGTLPARRAAKQDPIAALRYE